MATNITTVNATIMPFDGNGTALDPHGAGDQNLIPLDTMVAIVMVLGGIGLILNVMTLAALLNIRPKLQRFHYFLVNLTVSDLLVNILAILCAILMLQRTHELNKDKQKILQCASDMASETAFGMSLSPLIATMGLVINQYIAVSRPLVYQSIVTKHRVWIFIVSSWLFLLAWVAFAGWLSCKEIGVEETRLYILISSCIHIVIFILAATSVMVMYAGIYREARVNANSPPVPGSTGDTNRKLNITIAILAGTLIVFWTPSLLFTVVSIINIEMEQECTSCDTISKVSNWLMLANSICDPIIFGARLPDVRNGYRRIISKLKNIGKENDYRACASNTDCFEMSGNKSL